MNPVTFLRKYNLSYLFFLISIFVLPFSRRMFILSLWPWFLLWILEGEYLNKINKENFSENKWAIIMLPGLFLIFIVSFIWSKNLSYAMASIGEKTSLLIMPFFIAFSKGQIQNKNWFNQVQKMFILGLLVSSLFLLSRSLIKAISITNWSVSFDPVVNKWENIFLYYNFSYLIHPSYYAMMHLLGLSFCLLDIKKRVLHRKTLITLLLSVYFILIILLTSSRAGYISLLFVLINFFISYNTRFIVKIISIILLIPLSLIYINHSTRFRNIVEGFENNQQDSKIEAILKTNIRYDLWNSCFDIIKEKPLLGSGIGDIQDDLNKKYDMNSNKIASSRSFNAHNQFLENWLSSGISGLLILILCLYLPTTDKSLLYKDYYLYFLIILTTNFLFESIFNRLWGVAFFSIFYTLLTRRKPEAQN